jgi:hypothetical protein
LIVQDFVGGVAVASGAMTAVLQLLGWGWERAGLKNTLNSVVPGGRIRRREDVLAVWHLLRTTVRWDPALQTARRPWLRAPAGQTLRTGRGLCGENARLAVRLLRLGGCRANRLYLFGRRWGHVVVELWWEGGWRLFDAHADDDTLPSADQIGVVPSTEVAGFPNRHIENPWVGAATTKLLRKIPWLARRRLPGLLVEWAESPHLIRASMALLVAGAGLALLAR